MKKLIIVAATLAGLSLASFNVSARSDDNEYPAAYFEPKVVYIDKDAVKDAQKTRRAKKRKVQFDPKYPAAYFEPKVIYP